MIEKIGNFFYGLNIFEQVLIIIVAFGFVYLVVSWIFDWLTGNDYA